MNNINHDGDNNGDVDKFSNENIMDVTIKGTMSKFVREVKYLKA
jgi:hypothetical protein